MINLYLFEIVHVQEIKGMECDCVTGVADRLTEFIVKNICETALIAALHPRSAIIVVLQEMQNNGGVSFYKKL